MSTINDKLGYRVSWFMFVLLAIQTAGVLSSFTDVPPPPARPERFHSREELRRYLQLVHEYYAIIGRPRFGRSPVNTGMDPSDIHLFYMFDTNDDKSISYEEFHDLLGK
ncbi:unnamed protein product [Adineta steineri]|uniref:EF-hand domain-containing protein n=1 Tax=Adineta steineri TaxID=433720 RepID=A0A819JP14_9BILA|nr:unnamed protein product [Adineta steineri]CAF1082922.1 unnamed protein product [Adineta steineri]CAF1130073.1 unnamed protein product [Adineta steineri]CAF1130291.1 unnamed protein product [Adineta steineri]CAF1147337.1 unnamed protein product [Adineta steineri]